MIIEITGVTNGVGPYDIYLCDSGLTGCFYVSGVTTIPPTITIDSDNFFPGVDTLKIKIVDNTGCVDIINSICSPTCYAITILDTIVVEDMPLSAVYVPTNGYLYVNNSDSSSVSVIDIITNSVITTINVGLNNDGLIQYNPDNGDIYVPNRNSNTVSVIDTVTNTVITTISTGHLGYGSLYVTGVNKLYITDNLSVFLRVIDTTTNSVLGSVTLTAAASISSRNSLTYDTINGYIYVAISNFDVVDVVDPVTDTVVLSIPVGNSPRLILYSSINNYVYVVNYLDSTVSKIDTTTNTVVSTIPVGNGAVSIVETPLYIYVTNSTDYTITVIDINTDATITIPTTDSIVNSTYNPSNGYLYVNQDIEKSVLIIDTITNTVVSTIALSRSTTFGIYTPNNDNIYVNEVSKTFPFEDNMIELGCSY